MQPTPQMASALKLAGQGYKVFPCYEIRAGRCSCGAPRCKSPGKHPRLDDGLKGASCDVETVRGWWERWPQANVALVTGRYGEGKYLIVVDADAKHGGVLNLTHLEVRHGKLPPTARAFTGGGGEHVFLTSDRPLRNTASQLAPGVDTRGEGGYVLVAPSNHISGGLYRWDDDGGLETAAPLPMPPAWVDACDQGKGPRAARAPVGAADVIIEGGRNLHLTSLAGAMRRRGASERVILAALLEENDDRCRPTLDAAEVQVIAASVARYEPADAWKSVPRQSKEEAPGGAAEAPPPSSATAGTTDETAAASWEDLLIWTKKGGLVASLANLEAILRYAPEWARVLAYNEARGEVEFRFPPPYSEHTGPWHAHPITDPDEGNIAVFLERRRGLRIATRVVHEAVAMVARVNSYNPVTDYLGGLTWDGEKRLDAWLTTYCGAADTPYSRAVGAAWMRAAVARAFLPGCTIYGVLILEGPQGKGKSTAFRVLGGEFFADDLGDLESKDTLLKLRRSWLIEMPELAAARRSVVEQQKAFVTRTHDEVRAVYGRNTATVPRRCLFGGSTNSSEYLQDTTGNRRWWPVRVGQANLEQLVADRDQLWAETVATWRAGAGHNIPSSLWGVAAEEQEQRAESDPWEDAIRDHLLGLDETNLGQVIAAIGLRLEQVGDRESKRIVRLLARCGWQKRQVRRGSKVVRLYVPTGLSPPSLPSPPPPKPGSDRTAPPDLQGCHPRHAPEVSGESSWGNSSSMNVYPGSDGSDGSDKSQNVEVPPCCPLEAPDSGQGVTGVTAAETAYRVAFAQAVAAGYTDAEAAEIAHAEASNVAPTEGSDA